MSEGLVTVVSAIVLFFFVPAFPEEAEWLSDDEKAFVKARLAEDVGDSQLGAETTWRDALSVFKDFKIILGGLMYFGFVTPAYIYAYFAPTIIRSFGYSPVKTQLYSVFPSVATLALSMIVAVASDYYKRRFVFILPLLLASVTGVVILLTVHDNVNARYGALFLVTTTLSSAGSITICWFSANRETTPISSFNCVV